jgi:hypothetical protein
MGRLVAHRQQADLDHLARLAMEAFNADLTAPGKESLAASTGRRTPIVLDTQLSDS